jgi:hypothetical protein
MNFSGLVGLSCLLSAGPLPFRIHGILPKEDFSRPTSENPSRCIRAGRVIGIKNLRNPQITQLKFLIQAQVTAEG